MKDLTQNALEHTVANPYLVLYFCSPLLFKNYNESINWHRYFVGSIVPLIACAIFYINYLWLIPQYLIKGNKKSIYPNQHFHHPDHGGDAAFHDDRTISSRTRHHPHNILMPRPPLPTWVFVIRNIFIYAAQYLFP